MMAEMSERKMIFDDPLWLQTMNWKWKYEFTPLYAHFTIWYNVCPTVYQPHEVNYTSKYQMCNTHCTLILLFSLWERIFNQNNWSNAHKSTTIFWKVGIDRILKLGSFEQSLFCNVFIIPLHGIIMQIWNDGNRNFNIENLIWPWWWWRWWYRFYVKGNMA